MTIRIGLDGKSCVKPVEVDAKKATRLQPTNVEDWRLFMTIIETFLLGWSETAIESVVFWKSSRTVIHATHAASSS
jgi:hypothetical protein